MRTRSGRTSSTSKQASAASVIGAWAGEIGWAGAEGVEVVFGGERALQVGGEDGGVDVEDVAVGLRGRLGWVDWVGRRLCAALSRPSSRRLRRTGCAVLAG